MSLPWILAGAAGGLVAGIALGVVGALVAMSLGPPRSDGTYGLREMLVCVPAGAALGLVVGVIWGLGLFG